MAKVAQISFKDFRTRFAIEEDCREYLFKERFLNGVVCPKYGSREYSYLRTRLHASARSAVGRLPLLLAQ